MRDNGEIEMFNAYRVQHDNSRGPFKGGFRFSPQVSMDEIRRCVLKPAIAQYLSLSGVALLAPAEHSMLCRNQLV